MKLKIFLRSFVFISLFLCHSLSEGASSQEKESEGLFLGFQRYILNSLKEISDLYLFPKAFPMGARFWLYYPFANYYPCGSLTIYLEGDWFIHSLFMKNGVVLNPMDFSSEDKAQFTARDQSGQQKLLKVQQETGFNPLTNVYVYNHPIDLYLTVMKKYTGESQQLRITKNTCNPFKVGSAKVQLSGSERVHYQLVQSRLSEGMWTLPDWFWSPLFDPAYLIIRD